MKEDKIKLGVTSTPIKNTQSAPLDFTAMELEQSNNQAMSHLDRLLQNNHFGATSRKYTVKQLLDYLEQPERYSRSIVNASRYLSASSSYYMRLMFYMSRMLTLDHMVTPNHIDMSVMLDSKKKFEDQYLEALEYIESYHVKHEFGKILYTMVVEDVFFGYERRRTVSERERVTIQKLPMEYCKITGIKDGIFTFAFDMGYFGYDADKLREFPREFTRMYRKFLDTGQSWQPVNPNRGVCFKFREDLEYIFPPFAAVMPDVLDHQEIKDLLKSKNRLENFKLLLQKIPFKKDARSEKDYLINLKSVKMFHDNIKSVLPEEIGIISSPMEIDEYSFEKKNNSLNTTAQDSRDEIFDSAGMPSGLFATGGSKSAVALVKAIQTDEAVMFHVLRQFERFFNNRLASRYKDFSFQVMFPDLTVYNREDKADQYLKLAQYGVANKFLVASSVGLSATQLVGMTVLENEVLGMDELLKPLQSSHTSAGSDKESGGQTKSVNKLSDKGAETRDLGTNTERNETQ